MKARAARPPIGYSGSMPHAFAETTTPGHSRRDGGMF